MEVLKWWSLYTGIPMRSLIRQGVEAAADAIIDEYDPLSRRVDLPEDILVGYLYRSIVRGANPRKPEGEVYDVVRREAGL